MAPIVLAAVTALSCSAADRDALIGLLMASAAAQGRPEAVRLLGAGDLPAPETILGRIAALDHACGRD